MEAKLAKIYYSPRGHWKGIAAIKQLAAAAKVSEDIARAWLTKQALWQAYLRRPPLHPSTQVRCLATQCRAPSRSSLPSP